jgi:sugar/nucleoside kinase (ribokinase family)
LARSDTEDAPKAAEALLQRGAGRVLVTNGGHPAAEGRRGLGVIEGTPPPVLVTRVTGAGDTFMAAHLVAERRGATRQDALDEALRAAATYVSGDIGS